MRIWGSWIDLSWYPLLQKQFHDRHWVMIKSIFSQIKKVENIVRNNPVNPLREHNCHFLFSLTVLPGFTTEFDTSEFSQSLQDRLKCPGSAECTWLILVPWDMTHCCIWCAAFPLTLARGVLWVIINSFYGIFQWLGIKGSLHVPSLTSKGIIKAAHDPSDGWVECRRKCVPEAFGWALQWVQMNPFTESVPLTPLTLELFPWKPPCSFPTLRFSFLLVRNLECLFYLMFLSFALLEVLPSKYPKCLKHLKQLRLVQG